MISWIWIFLALFLGALFGFMIAVLLKAASIKSPLKETGIAEQ